MEMFGLPVVVNEEMPAPNVKFGELRVGDGITIEVKSGNAEADVAFANVLSEMLKVHDLPQPTGFVIHPELVEEHGAEQVVAAIEAPLHK